MAIKLEKIGRKLTHSDLAKFEREIGLALPEDFRRFMLTTNGGFPSKARYIFDGSELRLFEIFSLTASKSYGLRGRYADVKCEISEKLIPFGRDAGGELLCIKPFDGRVYRTAGYPDGGGDIDLLLVAESFMAFWEGLFEEVIPTDAFMRIAEHGAPEDVRELVAKGGSLSQKDINGLTLLEEAAKFGNVGVVNACLENGSEIGEALHRAIENREPEIARILLANGASLDAVDESDQTPEDYVFGSPEMKNLIAEFRALHRKREE